MNNLNASKDLGVHSKCDKYYLTKLMAGEDEERLKSYFPITYKLFSCLNNSYSFCNPIFNVKSRDGFLKNRIKKIGQTLKKTVVVLASMVSMLVSPLLVSFDLIHTKGICFNSCLKNKSLVFSENYNLHKSIPKVNCSSLENLKKHFNFTNPDQIAVIYAMLETIDSLLIKYDVKYWIGSGTLLGYERHAGIIPWDDDADIHLDLCQQEILESNNEFLNDLEASGLILVKHWGGYKLSLKTPLTGAKVYKNEAGDFTYPFIDIFITREIEKKIHIDTRGVDGLPKADWPYEYWTKDEISSIKRVPFGPIVVNAPVRTSNYLKRNYGANWSTEAYTCFDHQLGPIKPVKVTLTGKFPPTPYNKELFEKHRKRTLP